MAAYTVYWRHEYWKALPSEEAPIRRDRIASGDLLRSWRYLNRRGERKLRFLEGDEMARADSFWGIYRLHPETAEQLAAITGEGLTVAR